MAISGKGYSEKPAPVKGVTDFDISDSIATEARVFADTARKVLVSAKFRNYEGYSKFDALNSPLLEAFSFGNKWLRLIWTQAVKECPFHVRPLLGVRVSRNPKGIALFARAHFQMWELTGERFFLEEGVRLCDWLLANRSPGHERFCWGYNFIWQNTIFLQDKFEPNVVVSIFAGEAMVHAFRVTGEARFLNAAVSVAEFIVKDVPRVHDSEDETAIAYVLRAVDAAVLNNNVLAGALLAKVWKETGNSDFSELARRLMNYTVRRRTSYHAWYYTEPPDKSPIRHDNYHTGGILDGLSEYMEITGDDSFLEPYVLGLEYYRNYLFLDDGTPKWMNDRVYPLDVHGAAQGILSFAKAAGFAGSGSGSAGNHLEFAVTIAEWAMKRLYRNRTKDFRYRVGRLMGAEIEWNYSLMRWCNAWMSHALAALVLALVKKTQVGSVLENRGKSIRFGNGAKNDRQ